MAVATARREWQKVEREMVLVRTAKMVSRQEAVRTADADVNGSVGVVVIEKVAGGVMLVCCQRRRRS